MSLLIKYFIIGLVVTIMFDIAAHKIGDEKNIFTNFERIVVTIFWPIVLLVIIYHALIGSKKD